MTKTKLHSARLLDQIQTNLVGLQREIRNNAISHKQMALAQSPDLKTLQEFVADCSTQYLRRIGWLDAIWADKSKKQWVLDQAALSGMHESDIVTVANELREAACVLRDAPRGSYRDIAKSSDQILSIVDAPESLWPE